MGLSFGSLALLLVVLLLLLLLHQLPLGLGGILLPKMRVITHYFRENGMREEGRRMGAEGESSKQCRFLKNPELGEAPSRTPVRRP